jgi:DNA helicase-2/ATP-dependent DNA helicase PcrA
MEEERRLCYVGITRAMKKLYLTGAQVRTVYGRTDYQTESRFLGEMDRKCMDGDETIEEKVRTGSGLGGEGAYTGEYFFGGRSHGTADGYYGDPSPRPFDSLSAARKQTANKAKIVQEFANGDVVRHPKFGEGMVITQDEKTMTVIFDDFGEKKLGKGFVKMEKVQ